MTRGVIIRQLIKLARRIGRWILHHIISEGITMLVGYMNGKIGDFRRRLAHAKSERRKRWLRGRIRRWDAAMSWLRRWQLKIGDDVVAEADDAARMIPMVADAERVGA